MAKRPKADLRTCFVAPFLKITPDLLNHVMVEVIEANSAFIENLNREQLAAGIQANGRPINPPYTKATIIQKQEKGQPTDKVTLYDEGDFYKSIFTDVYTNAFDLTADDPKTEEIREKYGNGIFGLTPENKQKLINHIRPQFIAKLKQYIGFK